MATKKAASTAKKTPTKTSIVAKKPTTTTKVTTVKAVESRAATSKSSGLFSLTRVPLLPAIIAEFVGMFAFAATVVAVNGNPLYVFLALVGVMLSVGAISGGFANPALVIGAWATKRINSTRAVAYIVAQVLGAMLALVTLDLFAKAATSGAAGAYEAVSALPAALPLPEGKELYILLAEIVGTFVFGFAVAGTIRANKSQTSAALTIGFGAFLGLAIAGTAASFIDASAILNPAVAISLQALSFSAIWPALVYIVGPIIGAVGGFFLHDYLQKAASTAVVDAA